MAGGTRRRELRTSRQRARSHVALRAECRYDLELRARDFENIARGISQTWRGRREGRTKHYYEYDGKTLYLVFDWDIKQVITVLTRERKEIKQMVYADDLSDVARLVVSAIMTHQYHIRIPQTLKESDLTGIARALGNEWRVLVEELGHNSSIIRWQSCGYRAGGKQRQLIIPRNSSHAGASIRTQCRNEVANRSPDRVFVIEPSEQVLCT